MKKFKNFALKQPILFGVVLLSLYPVLATLTYPVRYLFPGTEVGQVYSDTTAKIILTLVFLGVLWGFGWIRASGITRLGNIRLWPVISVILVYHLLVDLYVFTGDIAITLPNSPLAIAKLAYYLPGSLMEETVFRGLILLAMVFAWGNSKQGLVKAILFSSLFFGLIHLFNIGALSVGAAVLQAVGAAMLGVLWGALVLATRSLWPAILLHWLTNAAVNIKLIGYENIQETSGFYANLAIVFIPLMAYGAYLIWKLPETHKEEAKYAVPLAWKPGILQPPGD